MEIYVKPIKKIAFANESNVRIKDICEITCPKEIKKEIEEIILLTIDKSKKESYLINIIDIINGIKKLYSNATIYNVGEPEVWVDYSPVKEKDSKFLVFFKVAFVSLVLFAGSATAIMTFHNESAIIKIFSQYNKMLFNGENINMAILNVSYSFGLFFGIVLFFNHLGGKKITNDPTPIEVEISTYQSDISDTVIDLLNSEDEHYDENN